MTKAIRNDFNDVQANSRDAFPSPFRGRCPTASALAPERQHEGAEGASSLRSRHTPLRR